MIKLGNFFFFFFSFIFGQGALPRNLIDHIATTHKSYVQQNSFLLCLIPCCDWELGNFARLVIVKSFIKKKMQKESNFHLSNWALLFKWWRCLLVDPEGLCGYIKSNNIWYTTKKNTLNKYTVLWDSKSIQIQRWKALEWA